jgi:hypothetical protein
MDADRFDALSRALSSPGSRRSTLSALLGALLGGALPVLVPDALAARKEKGKRRATRKDRQQAAESEGGEVRASDVGAAGHCLPPGQKKCFAGTDCCSGRCKIKKKKCLGCLKGTEYCAAQEACVAPGTCTTSCPTGTADCDDDGVCETDTTTSEQHCGGCNQPCDSNQTCVNGVCTGSSTCAFPCSGDKVCDESRGFCVCPAERPVQCEFNSGRCSANPQTDSTRCGLHCYDCEQSYAPGYHCCNGQCVNGCGPATNGSCAAEPCGASCTPCTGGKLCCNLGPGTTGQCVDPVAGYCPSLATQP